MASNRSRRKAAENGDESYFVSMTDIMVGMLFVFILIIMYFSYQLKIQSEAQDDYAQSATDHRTQLLGELKAFLEGDGSTKVEIDAEQGILRVPEGVLFASGIADIEDGSPSDLFSTKLASAFATIVTCSVLNEEQKVYEASTSCISKNPKRAFIESIFVEGHTDNIPVPTSGLRNNRKLNSNLRLSARRATNTYENMLKKQPTLATFRSPKNEQIFAVSAYGETRPIDKNMTKAGRANNRRIDIRLLMYIPENSAALFDYKKRLEAFYEVN
jgi:flagellar motor protein MotB